MSDSEQRTLECGLAGHLFPLSLYPKPVTFFRVFHQPSQSVLFSQEVEPFKLLISVKSAGKSLYSCNLLSVKLEKRSFNSQLDT